MTVCGLRVQPATTLSDSDQQQMRSKKSNNKARMKCWFPDMLSQHPENCTDGLTELHNSVAKQPPKTPLKQEKEKSTTKPPKPTVHHRTVVQLHAAKYKW